MPETLYSHTLEKSYSGLQVKAVPLLRHRYLHKFLIGVETIKITVGAYAIRPTSKVQCYRAYFIRAYAIRPLRSSPQCYLSRVGMLTIICVDTYALGVKRFFLILNCGQ